MTSTVTDTLITWSVADAMTPYIAHWVYNNTIISDAPAPVFLTNVPATDPTIADQQSLGPNGISRRLWTTLACDFNGGVSRMFRNILNDHGLPTQGLCLPYQSRITTTHAGRCYVFSGCQYTAQQDATWFTHPDAPEVDDHQGKIKIKGPCIVVPQTITAMLISVHTLHKQLNAAAYSHVKGTAAAYTFAEEWADVEALVDSFNNPAFITPGAPPLEICLLKHMFHALLPPAPAPAHPCA